MTARRPLPRLTDPQLAVLRVAGEGRLYRSERDGATFIVRGPYLRIEWRTAARITDPELDLVTLGPIEGGGRRWDITDRGREVLAAANAAPTDPATLPPELVDVEVVLTLVDRYRTAPPAQAAPLREQIEAVLVDDLTTLSRLRQVAALADGDNGWDWNDGAGAWLGDMFDILGNRKGETQ